MFKIVKSDNTATISLTERRENEILYLDIDYKTDEIKIPGQFSVCWDYFGKDVASFFSPALREFRGKNVDWMPAKSESRLAYFAPVHTIVSRDDRNRLNITLSDVNTPTAITTGINEKQAVFRCRVSYFTLPTTPIKEYHTTIRLDYRDIPYYDSIYDTVKYWENECGYTPAFVPEAAKLPVDSLWYSFHQNLDHDEIIKECKLSKPLGMDTVIIDDGWQTEDCNGAYAFCGDWELCEKKMGNMRELVDELHKIGMKVMLWYSVPFIGYKSKNFARFESMLLCHKKRLNTAVLDPRYKQVREFIVDTYVNAVKDWGLDGLKLDFIDEFMLDEEAAGFDERRDFESLEQSIDCLLNEIMTKLSEINPDILIEFRQRYIGPTIRKYGNMLRVRDCPADGVRNRSDMINLRFTSGKTPVHSDMLLWNKTDSPEEVAYQLASVIYTVPQVSLKIAELPREQLEVLEYYLKFWREHRDILLDGYFTADNPEGHYSSARATKDGTEIISVYTDTFVKCQENKSIIINASGKTQISVLSRKAAEGIVVSSAGKEIEALRLAENTASVINVPMGAMVFIAEK